MPKLSTYSDLAAPTLDDKLIATDSPGGTPATGNVSVDRLGGLLSRNAVGGRLTLTAGSPVTTADVTGATSVYFTPYSGSLFAGLVSLYDGARWRLYTFAERTLALGTLTAGLPYDVFLYDNAGTLTLEAVAWTNATTRATALATQDGILVKSGATTRRYLGTFYTTAATTTEDSAAKRYLWNYYNRVRRRLYVGESTAQWNYSTDTIRQANGSTANQLAFVLGVAEDFVTATVRGSFSNTNAAGRAYVAIGLDSTTAVAAGCLYAVADLAVANENTDTSAHWTGYPGIGAHVLTWLENTKGGQATGAFYGTNGANTQQCGIFGELFG